MRMLPIEVPRKEELARELDYWGLAEGCRMDGLGSQKGKLERKWLER